MKDSKNAKILEEVKRLKFLNEEKIPGVVKFIEAIELSKTCTAVVTPLLNNPLSSMIEGEDSKNVYSLGVFKTIMEKLLDCIATWQRQGIYHCDLNIENVFWENNEVIAIDWADAIILSQTDTGKSIEEKRKIEEGDLPGAGEILWELFTSLGALDVGTRKALDKDLTIFTKPVREKYKKLDEKPAKDLAQLCVDMRNNAISLKQAKERLKVIEI